MCRTPHFLHLVLLLDGGRQQFSQSSLTVQLYRRQEKCCAGWITGKMLISTKGNAHSSMAEP